MKNLLMSVAVLLGTITMVNAKTDPIKTAVKREHRSVHHAKASAEHSALATEKKVENKAVAAEHSAAKEVNKVQHSALATEKKIENKAVGVEHSAVKEVKKVEHKAVEAEHSAAKGLKKAEDGILK